MLNVDISIKKLSQLIEFEYFYNSISNQSNEEIFKILLNSDILNLLIKTLLKEEEITLIKKEKDLCIINNTDKWIYLVIYN